MQGFGTVTWRSARRVGDANAPLLTGRPHRTVRGFTLIEAVTVAGLLGVILGIAVPHLPRGTYDLWAAQVEFLADMRRARANALTKGDHFRLIVTSATQYEVRRMLLQSDGTWIDRSGPALVSRSLRDGITFTAGVNNAYEFNTRGLLVIPGVVETVALADSVTGRTRGVTVWPSGQVSPEI